jgi:hypothetical protein
MSYSLEGGTLIHVCANQQSCQWLIKAVHRRRLKKETPLKATDAKDFLRPVKVALRTSGKQSKDTEELLRWIQDLNLELHTDH